jgi:hypothetical protein
MHTVVLNIIMLQEPLQIRGLKMLIVTLDMLLEIIMIIHYRYPDLKCLKEFFITHYLLHGTQGVTLDSNKIK